MGRFLDVGRRVEPALHCCVVIFAPALKMRDGPPNHQFMGDRAVGGTPTLLRQVFNLPYGDGRSLTVAVLIHNVGLV